MFQVIKLHFCGRVCVNIQYGSSHGLFEASALTKAMFGWSLVIIPWHVLRLQMETTSRYGGGGGGIANIVNYQLQTADKGQSSSLEVRWILWNRKLTQYWTWNIRLGSLKTTARQLAKYRMWQRNERLVL